MFAFKVESLLFVSSLILSVGAQVPKDPVSDVCRRFSHQTAVIDRKLYIDGGWLYASPMESNPEPTISQDLIYSDLNETFKGMPKQYANLTKNNTIPNVAGGILWPDEVNKVLWLYGGEFYGAPNSFELWGYDIILNQWNYSRAPIESTTTIRRVAYGSGATIGGKGYYYGGYLNERTNPLWEGPPLATTGLIVFDLDKNRLDNTTGPDSIGRAEGSMVSIPASAGGMLIYFGGVTYPYGNSTEVPMSMSDIIVYDVGDNRWYTQTATGDIPADRRKFCAGATWADDQSSYNVYLYGGMGFAENETGFDDVYILSMPTFEWIKWYPEKAGEAFPKHSLSCNVVDNGQMLIIGGNYTNQSTLCDLPEIGGQHNLNLGQLDATNAKWYSYLPNLTEYAVPADILSVTGGSSDGGAQNLAPVNGWDSPNLEVYFGAKAQFDPREPTRYIPPPTSAATATPTPSPEHKTNIGAIAGGVVGGVVFLVIIAVLAWYCLRRRKAKKAEQEASQGRPSMSSNVNELTGDPTRDNKSAIVTSSHGSPEYYSPHQGQSPYTTPPPMHTPQQMPYQHPGQSPHQQYSTMQQQPYGYPHFLPGSGSPSAVMYPQPQQYYPPPDMNRGSPPLAQSYEMPIASTPGIHHVVYQPTPQRVDVVDSITSRSQEQSRSDRHSRTTSGM